MLGWFKGLSIGARLISAAVALALLVAGYMTVQRYFSIGAKTENKLNKGLGGAAMESGGDAVDTVSNRASSEQEVLKTVEEQDHEIRNQADAGGVTGAGRSSVCQRAPNRRGCGVVPRPPAR